MSEGINMATLLGNLGADPEIRELPNGGKVANFRMATSRSWKNKSGEWETRTEWHRIVCFGYEADRAERILRKGAHVFVMGEIVTRKWQSQDGQDRYTTEIRANVLRLCGTRADREGQDQHYARTTQTARTSQGRASGTQERGGGGWPQATNPASRGAIGDDFDDNLPF